MNKYWQKVKQFFAAAGNFISEKKWILLKAAAYMAVVALFYFIFLWFIFPYNELSTLLTNKVRGSTSMDLSIRKAEGAFPVGLKLYDVIVTTKIGKNESPLLEARTIELTPAVLSLFRGWMGIKIHARLYNGRASLEIGRKRTDFYVKGVITDTDIGRYSLLKSNYGLNMDGTLNVKLDLSGSLHNIAGDSGSGLISMNNVLLKPSTLFGIFSLPKLDFGTITFPFFIKNGKLDIQDASQKSRDINSQIDGSIMLADPVGNSALNLKLKFDPTPETEQLIRKTVPFFMLTRDTTGYFHVSVTGNLLMPRMNQ